MTGYRYQSRLRHYAQRYVGTPAENSEGYRLSNVLAYAGSIRDRLMIIHEMADDHVPFANTMLRLPTARARPSAES